MTRLVGSLLIMLFFFASMFPESSIWGINQLAFLGWTPKLIILLLLLVLVYPGTSRFTQKALELFDTLTNPSTSFRLMFILLIASAAVSIFYLFTMQTDMYGDSRVIISSKLVYSFQDIFILSKTEPLSRYLPQLIANTFAMERILVYRLIAYTFGGLYIVLLLAFISGQQMGPVSKAVFFLIGLSGGALGLYFGHVENYVIAYTLTVAYFILGWRFYDRGGGRLLVGMGLLILVGSRFHVVMMLLVPGFIISLLTFLSESGALGKQWVAGRTLIVYVCLSVAVMVLAYFFLFHAYIIDEDKQEYLVKKIFLPLINTVPLMNNYTLQSPNHLIDFSQTLAFLISPAVFYCMIILFLRRNCNPHPALKDPRIQFYLVNCFYFILFVFTMNPILSIARDWDLFAIVNAPVMFLCFALIIHGLNDGGMERLWMAAFPFMLSLALVSNSIVLMNNNPGAVGARLRSLGMWVYESSHGGSSYLINVGCKTISDPHEQILERQRIIDALTPFRKPDDMEFSFLEQKLAELYYLNGQSLNARIHFERALAACATHSEPLGELGVLLLKMRLVEEGNKRVDEYNQTFNDPTVQNGAMLVVAHIGQYVEFLSRAGVDPSEIAKALEVLEVVPKQ